MTTELDFIDSLLGCSNRSVVLSRESVIVVDPLEIEIAFMPTIWPTEATPQP